ncbi:hypothetical protein GOA53_03960 [Sinorhizobium meliloti]|uniref:hypothetical protein n=1 Tax=Rhizobium meliloti TaxID=382 RepID=UPI001296C314|nr:hypothetical protein [Sinorhizobium meliloti]MDW9428608.1 hypothetical protein [Sinorhizobium meliloti]MQV78152.1 hypothetical protein [Sinorhizobium meliloti]
MASYDTMPVNARGDPSGPPPSVRVVLGGVMLLALLLGIDFLAHGLAWLRFAFFPGRTKVETIRHGHPPDFRD